MKQRSTNSWILGVMGLLQEINMLELLEVRNGKSKDIFKVIQHKIVSTTVGNLKTDCETKRSLATYVKIKTNIGAEKYLELGRGQRRALAMFRMGVYKWKSVKDESGNYLCSLCGEIENEKHILFDCKELHEHRGWWWDGDSIHGKITELYKTLNETDIQKLIDLVRFLQVFFSLREQALKSVDNNHSSSTQP